MDANKLAKTDDARRGLYIIDTEEKRVEALKKLPIGDVWGIGRRHEKRLTAIQRTLYYLYKREIGRASCRERV